SDDVFLVSPPRPAYAGLDAPVRRDLYGETGPLGGIASSLAHARHEHCLVVSCDMPFLNLDLLHWMIAQPRTYDVLVPRLRAESRQGGEFVYQTMHAIYGKGCLPAIERALAEGRRQTVTFFAEVNVESIGEDVVRRFDPNLRSFFSVNTPEALAIARGPTVGTTEPKSDHRGERESIASSGVWGPEGPTERP
ncbi:MAG TPA: molybdenum cofactor guanylyltransferase, partial [Thermomicrobiales bacterium]|nr:molybdenum cofactor guanylyltransferase [Thermomicrobiales bacterium]